MGNRQNNVELGRKKNRHNKCGNGPKIMLKWTEEMRNRTEKMWKRTEKTWKQRIREQKRKESGFKKCVNRPGKNVNRPKLEETDLNK